MPNESQRPDLNGQRILLVGGLLQRVSHLKRLVESYNGRLIHHDGGMEESLERLDSLFGRVDAVIFPVNCVSHAAQGRLKRLCRRWDKPFLPLRRSGLSAFAETLESYAARPPRA